MISCVSPSASSTGFYRLLEDVAEQRDDTTPPESIILALRDDLNTPEAYAGLHELRDIAAQMEGGARAKALLRLRAAGRLMGFFKADPAAWFKGERSDGPAADDIDALLVQRAEARKAKDFATSDKIRDDLLAQGIVIEDGPDGATWRRE